METRQLMPYGYKIITGAILPDVQVDAYNRIQERINAFAAANMPVPEYLLNDSHNLMAGYIANSMDSWDA